MPQPTDEELLDEILNGPGATELAPIWNPTDGNKDNTDVGTWAVLNRKNLPGYVLARDVAVYLALQLKWGIVDWAYLHKLMPDGTDASYQVFNICSTLHLAVYGTIQPPIHLQIDKLSFAMDYLVSLKQIDLNDKAAILAKEVKISLIESRFGYDVAVSIEQIARVRNAQKG